MIDNFLFVCYTLYEVIYMNGKESFAKACVLIVFGICVFFFAQFLYDQYWISRLGYALSGIV